MKIHRVGTGLLDDHYKTIKSKQEHHTVYKYAQDRHPIITPFLKSSITSTVDNPTSDIDVDADTDADEGQQYLLIPNKDHILVLSLEHGHTVCKLIPSHDTESENKGRKEARTIESATIMKLTCDVDTNDDSLMSVELEEWVVMAGFSNGMLQEWTLSSIALNGSGVNKTILPNRKFKLPDDIIKDGINFGKVGISHITSPVGGKKGLLYALVTIGKNIKFVRVNVPSIKKSADNKDNHVEELLSLNDLTLLATTGKQKKDNGSTEVKNLSILNQPHDLMSVCCERKGHTINYVAITEKRSLTIYYENEYLHQTNINISDRFVRYNQQQVQSDICAVAMAPNGEDMALGYKNGKIDILVSLLSQIATYVDDTSPTKTHPKYSLLKRTIHWHSLPVKTLRYLGLPGSRAAPNLLSGGEEAVLVTWNIERGLNRPTYTLPRISKGSITHIATNSYSMSNSTGAGGMDIIVRCMDNTLQLIEGHNHAVRWKIQGLASSNNECVDAVSTSKQTPSVVLRIDPRTQTPLMTGLSGAPGFLHWYDLSSNQVVGELEVAPYNRISRKEVNHKAYPRPIVTKFVLSSSGNDLVTVDTMLTENTSLGKGCEVKSFVKGGNDLSEKMSLVTNIKFWTWSREMERRATVEQHGKGMPYELISAMPNPHGHLHGEIDALALSPTGSRACSLSKQEGTFHIWGKGKTLNTEKNSLTPLLPSWKRLCKITIPSGYSNSLQQESGQDKESNVTFSSDGSVLAIAFGRHVTLWDHSNATLLNTLCAPEYLRDIEFVRSPLDMLLTIGKSSVSILAPFSDGYLGNDSWSYNLPENSPIEDKKIELSLVTPLAGRKELAVAIRQTEKNGNKNLISTKIVLIDVMSGRPKNRKDGSICNWYLEGNVQCLCDISQTQKSWASEEAVLLVLTSSNEMFVLDAEEKNSTPLQNNTERGCFARIENNDTSVLSAKGAPRLEMIRKRKPEILELSTEGASAKFENDSLVGKGSLVFDAAESTSLSTSQLPALSGKFTQSFVSRNFKKFRYSS